MDDPLLPDEEASGGDECYGGPGYADFDFHSPYPNADEEMRQIDEYIAECRESGRPYEMQKLIPPCFRRYDPPITVYEFLKTLINTFTLLPLRVILLLVGVMTHWVLVRLLILFVDYKTKPLAPWRRRILNFTGRLAGRIMLFAAGFMWLHEKDKVRNLDQSDSRPPTVMFNHSGMLEIPISAYIAYPAWVSKKALINMPILGIMMHANRSLFVERSDSGIRAGDRNVNQRNAELSQLIIDRQRNYKPPEPQVTIFPEGTATNNKYLLMLRKGSFVSGMPVQPIAFRYKWKRWDPFWAAGPKGPLSGAYHVYRLMTQFVNTLEIIYLPVYRPNAEERANPELYASHVRRVIASALDVPYIDGIGWQEKYLCSDYTTGRITAEEYVERREKLLAIRGSRQ